MKNVVVVLALVLTACSQPPPSVSFADRVASAEALEGTPLGAAYVTQLLKEHGDGLKSFAGECYGQTELQRASFKLVADITPDGRFENVVVQPESPPTKCYAKKVSELKVSAARPLGYGDKSFPLFINVNYNK